MRELRQNWKDLFVAFKIAKDPWKVILGIGGLIVLSLGIWGITAICVKAAPVAAILMAIILGGLVSVKTLKSDGKGKGKILAVVATWVILLALAAILIFGGDKTRDMIKPIVNGLWALLVMALFGGAIVRSAAVELATDDRISISEAFGFACKRYFSFLFAPLMPVVILLFLGVCVLLAHGLITIPWFGFFFSFLLTPLMILAGFIVAVVLIGLVFGFVLMFPTIGAEGSDSFDAISRAYSYVFMRPWRFIWYNGVALAYLLAITLFLSLFARYSITAVHRAGKVAFGFSAAEQVWPYVYKDINDNLDTVKRPAVAVLDRVTRLDFTGSLRAASAFVINAASLPRMKLPKLKTPNKLTRVVVSFFVHIYVGVFVAMLISMTLTLNTIVYFLLRKDVDGNELTEVYLEEEEEAEEPLKEALQAVEEAREEEKAEPEGEAEAPAGEEPSAGEEASEEESSEE